MMPHMTGVVDVSAWCGRWPFDLNGETSLEMLADRLAQAGVREALVSPLDAVLAPDPMPANRALVAASSVAERLSIRVHVVPVIDPVLATWRDDLAEMVESAHCRAVRLLPTWHGWGPEHPDAREVLRSIAQAGCVPILQARMLDERALPPSAAQASFDVSAVAAWLESVSDVRVILAGLYQSELAAVVELEHVAVDLSFVESGDTLANALGVFPPERILPGTHAPVFEPLAGVSKLPVSGPDRERAIWIARESARIWFDLPATGASS
ncbi:MAG TPA: hypothetical protein VNZ58_08840 [Thermomicrobiales bacterium]|nr:hypothetical protein [Thermomicrobiales bacterium]